MKPKILLIVTIPILLILLFSIFNSEKLLLQSCLLSIKCRGFKAENFLSMEIKNPSIIPKIAFLELRSPATTDYLVDEWDVQTDHSDFLSSSLSEWIGFPLVRENFKLLIPVVLYPKTSLKLDLNFKQVIRNRLDLPIFRLAGFNSSLPWAYSINFDSDYRNVHSDTNPKLKADQKVLNIQLDAGSQIGPRFEWTYQQILPMRAWMG